MRNNFKSIVRCYLPTSSFHVFSPNHLSRHDCFRTFGQMGICSTYSQMSKCAPGFSYSMRQHGCLANELHLRKKFQNPYSRKNHPVNNKHTRKFLERK